MCQEQKKSTPTEQWRRCLQWADEKDRDFQERYSAMGLNLKDFSLREIATLPLQEMTKDREVFSQLTLPLSGVARLIGKTTYLKDEMEFWEKNCVEWLRNCGINRSSVLLIADGFAEEGPSWGVVSAAQSLQAMVVTMSKHPWDRATECGASACVLTRDLLSEWIDSGHTAGTCQMFFCLSSDLSDAQRQEWQNILGVPVYRQLGLLGVQASAVGWECPAQEGYHFNMDVFWPEIIESVTKKVIPASREGKLVITALQRRSTMAIRLQTGWQGHFAEGSCSCGSIWPRFIRSEVDF